VAVVCRALALALALAPAAPGAARDLELPPTGEAALAQPMVVLGVTASGTRPEKPRADDDLADLLGGLPALALLDTGASGHVLSQASAARFGVDAESGSRYVETGMSGEHPMTVSRPVTLVVGDVEPEDEDARPKQRRHAAEVRQTGHRLMLNESPADLASALASPGSLVDVIGMPLIREHVVEIEPVEQPAGAVAVRLHGGGAALGVDAWVTLVLVDFNRRHPKNRGPAPSLASNPLVEDVTTTVGASRAHGDWLLDTGAACSMISTATARRLGLVDAAGKPARRPDFTLPIGGIGGGHEALPGYRLDALAIPADRDRTLVFPHAAVVVRDVTTIRADGTEVTLDGILGMNLLLPSGSGMTMLGAAEQLPGAFRRVVVDVAGKRLGLTLRR
jgi:hypothetical protein